MLLLFIVYYFERYLLLRERINRNKNYKKNNYSWFYKIKNILKFKNYPNYSMNRRSMIWGVIKIPSSLIEYSSSSNIDLSFYDTDLYFFYAFFF